MEKYKYLIGMVYKTAEKELKREGMKLRMVVLEEEPLFVTAEYNSKRINVAVVDDKIIEIINIG